MEKKEVLFLLTEHWADWYIGQAMAQVSFADDYVSKTISIDKHPKTSIGGLKAEIDYSIEEYQSLDNLALIVLVGGGSWRNNRYDEIADFVSKANNSNIPVAAICGATVFLAKHGFLNNVMHTSNGLDFFKERLEDEKNYTGWDHFTFSQSINDGGFITANETAALEFAREIMLVLAEDEADFVEYINDWYKKHKHGSAPHAI
ncbi:MAG: DJ-1/PfpI family protein [Defluviitaleaceae bacterium]|nr:DJ-1/PfpI family protein [Defluviitaleaceae bacterium]